MNVESRALCNNARRLCDIALARLPGMLDPPTGLMVFRLQGPTLLPVGTSLRYTAIAALGLERAEACGFSSAVDLGRLYEAMDATLAGADNVGDIALVLWAAARCRRPLAERALGELREFSDAVRSRRGTVVHTTELAWVSIALAEALGRGLGNERDVRARLDRTFRRLLAHRGRSGLLGFSRPFFGAPTAWNPRGYLNTELAFFDAQVYGVMAALRRDAVVDDAEAREAGRRIGEHLLASQQPLGQWGWRYNTRTGALVDAYPVYSVHQDGMAPMALLPLAETTSLATSNAVGRGINWLFGHNELRTVLASETDAVIWRSVRRRAPYRSVVHPLKAASLVGSSVLPTLAACLSTRSLLEVDREVRPYHLGWCLYALSELAAKCNVVADGDLPAEPTLRAGQSSESDGTSAASEAR